MSNFKGSINLMSLLGANVVSMEVNGVVKNVVAIPVEWNDITVTVNSATGKPNAAYLNVRAWETNDTFKKACIERNEDKEDYTPPSHSLQVNYSEEFQQCAQKSAISRLLKDENFMAVNPSEEDIKKKAKYEVNNKSRIGTLTPLARKQPQAFSGQAEQANVSEYVPNASGYTQDNPDDDLPF